MAGVIARRCERAACRLLSEVRAIATFTPAGAEHGRQPGIHFPPRRTPAGERISDLVADKATPVAQASTPPPPPPLPPAAAPAASAVPKPAALTAAGFNATATEGGVPPRRTLTDAEREAIMLGGAAP
jgi:hypothetical protein